MSNSTSTPTLDALIAVLFSVGSRWRLTMIKRIDTRETQQQTLIGLLSDSIQERRNLGNMIMAHANEHHFHVRGRMRWLARLLKEGESLPDALERTPGLLTYAQTSAIRYGAELGILPKVLKHLAGETRNSGPTVRQRFGGIIKYLSTVFFIALFFGTSQMLFIVPTIIEIFAEFGLDVPDPLRLFSNIGVFISKTWWYFALALGLLWYLSFSRTGARYLYRVWLPRISRSANKLRSAEVMTLLSLAIDSGRPLAGAISTLARHHYDSRIRRKLLYIRNEVEQGSDGWTVMRDSMLITDREKDAISSAIDPKSVSWTLQHLANLRRQQVMSRLSTIFEFIRPTVTLCLGLFVLVFIMSVWSPLISLILNLL